ncbi:T20D4.11-like domain-containing protein [Caenorhabditis elegans]|uniref:T20D4.11-like domain-containing protein n=1 Tax=Caenorhabditis elegans TaxID=6239 RepID=B5BM45_CAEEL|nr:DUF19 domain-containing protein [Caenorhabditis elegans]CAR31489.1 DUF19 domain-containing protein [Caenorhabditis elegans]|eukprot:NP_001129896.1 Uncharacterized protein CELE_F38A6.5 [Caenorhabditis elegans]
MRFYSILSIFLICLNENSAFFIPPSNFEKCGFEDSLGIILCIVPVTSLFEGNINLANMTRARGIRIVDECRNATTCIAQFPCATNVQLDKVFGLLCDAFSYFSTDFAPCQKKILAQMPPCMRKAEKTLLKSDSIDHPCELISKHKPCLESEITNICGEEYWKPLDNTLNKLQKYAQIKCPNLDN